MLEIFLYLIPFTLINVCKLCYFQNMFDVVLIDEKGKGIVFAFLPAPLRLPPPTAASLNLSASSQKMIRYSQASSSAAGDFHSHQSPESCDLSPKFPSPVTRHCVFTKGEFSRGSSL